MDVDDALWESRRQIVWYAQQKAGEDDIVYVCQTLHDALRIFRQLIARNDCTRHSEARSALQSPSLTAVADSQCHLDARMMQEVAYDVFKIRTLAAGKDGKADRRFWHNEIEERGGGEWGRVGQCEVIPR